jgi:hypothetical protein
VFDCLHIDWKIVIPVLLIQVKATDADEGVNSQVKYSITGGEQKEHFSIDEDSGFINTATKLDFESKESYSLTVTGNAFFLNTTKSNTVLVNFFHSYFFSRIFQPLTAVFHNDQPQLRWKLQLTTPTIMHQTLNLVHLSSM